MYCKVLFLSIFVPFMLTGAEIRQVGEVVLLRNSLIHVEVNPGKGGRVSRLLDLRSGRELTEINASPGGSGLFGDSFHNPTTNKSDRLYENSKYRVVAKEDGDKALLTLESPAGLPLAIQKTFVLSEQSDTLLVNYQLTNPGQGELTGVFRSMNAFAFPGEEQYTIQFPEGGRSNSWNASDKVQSNRFLYRPLEGKARDLFIWKPARDYVFVQGSECAAILSVPFSVLDFFYSWMSSAPEGMALVDWFSTPFQLMPLSKGKEEAVLHEVLSDPLQDYKYQFSMSVRVPASLELAYENYREKSAEAKSTRFQPLAEEISMHEDFQTPALIWNPLPGEKIRLLALSIAHGNTELGEFNRRLNTHMDLVETGNATSFKPSPYFGWPIPLPEARIKYALKNNPEVILVCGHHEKNVPEDVLTSIVKSIEQGAAFIYVSENNQFPCLIPQAGGAPLDPAVYHGVLSESLPGFAEILEYPRGKGKVFWVKFKMLPKGMEWVRESRVVIPYVNPMPENFAFWEYYYAFYGKLLRYASGRQVPATIQASKIAFDEIVLEIVAEEALPEVCVELTLDSPMKRHAHFASWQGALKTGGNRVHMALPADSFIGKGRYYFNFILSNSRMTLDWFSQSKDFPGTADIVGLIPDKPFYAKTDAISGHLMIEGQGNLELLLREAANGRVAAKQNFPAASGTVTFHLQYDLLSKEKLFDLEANLSDRKGNLLARKNQMILVEPRQAGPVIRPLLWASHIASWRELMLNREFADMGIAILKAPLGGSKDAQEILNEVISARKAGMEYGVLGVEHITCRGDRNSSSAIRTPCLRDPVYLEKVRERARAVGEKMRAARVDMCWVSDEVTLGRYFNTPHDLCQSEHCLKAFQNSLKNKYQDDLALLNRNWKTAFANWAALRPLNYAESQRTKNFTSWMEHRAFMMNNMTQILKMITEEIQSVAPGSEVGLSGMTMTRLYQGFDLLETIPFLKISCFYLTPFSMDAVRSFSGESHRIGSYTDYGVRYGVWEQLIGGMRTPSVWWYGHCMRNGDGRLSSEGLHLKKIFASIKDSGADLVLSKGVRRKSPLTLVWSTSSLVTAGASGATSAITHQVYEDSAKSWSQLIRDMGMDSANVMTTASLPEIHPDKNPVIILFLTQCLSDAEIAALDNYVHSGGTLIADLNPGVYDEFYMMRQENPLSKVFGVEISGDAAVSQAGSLRIEDATMPASILGGSLSVRPGAKAAGSVQMRSKALEIPGIRVNESTRKIADAGLIHSYGKGCSLYMNFAISNYYTSNSRRQNESSPVVASMTKLFDKVGIRVSGAHRVPNGCNFAEYSYAGVRYLFLSRGSAESDGRYEINLGGSFHVYDMFLHQYLGKYTVYDGQLVGNQVMMIALLPEKPGSLNGQITFDGRRFLVAAGQSPSRVPVITRLKVSHDGKNKQALSENYVWQDGLNTSLDAGLQPANGHWQIILQNLMTGEELKKSFQLQ